MDEDNRLPWKRIKWHFPGRIEGPVFDGRICTPVEILPRNATTFASTQKAFLMTIKGARDNYGVVIDPADLRVCEAEIEVLRKDIKAARDPAGKALEYDRGGTIEELRKSCLKETGLPAPSPQWELDPYGPHMQIPYVKERFLQMKEAKGWKLQ
ncbi:uncharacterized protein ATNIH1004_006542 [Aspergillus tanneri]|uniref:Uncharacterized protein n=1 Tax=Aspergillus tanneri TaxID=1220188 RepID=A0A5M9MRB6_9EURO|nr:uncharacterized protein ATNIH1004_006542 [Aspergillus tanneri]KAA8647840.1 hypothetical protein ATNIH1004_006542 [Aspergillus tanneri]